MASIFKGDNVLAPFGEYHLPGVVKEIKHSAKGWIWRSVQRIAVVQLEIYHVIIPGKLMCSYVTLHYPVEQLIKVEEE